ncbi:hypothetical protein TanjilG_26241 [Lupinus angustifolius]|uniref:Phytocyanin domain-containing protein n=1 Tax=Lupinus angustifolius TaxID=3871 RepID=A0A4P1R2W0_LUPAN|nr:PREDICTED: blue copper protein-like [Lupinus angustifolius]OIV99903.1 hypothetical protein TanjilG_26241 [Lupinus angustifolius]
MTRNMNTFVIVLLTIATLLHGSVAQTRHVVGDSTGWTIPSGGAATYTTWAANKTFTLGDTLVFNFANGQHDVAKVTKSDFDACNGGSAFFTLSTSPATVTLNETGDQYYICAFTGHCSIGQKLAIKVTEKGSTSTHSPAPQHSDSLSPRTSPVAAPAPKISNAIPPLTPVPESAPAPSTRAVTYTVGDTIGWTIPNNGASAYVTWASRNNFKVGDVLVFNYQMNAHNVEEVTKEKYDSCSSVSPIVTYNNPPVSVTLNKSGPHYFICGFTGHCSAGQKLAINVSGTATATSPSATPPSTSTTSSSPSPTNAGGVSPPPQNSGAASLGSLGVYVVLLSIATAFYY